VSDGHRDPQLACESGCSRLTSDSDTTGYSDANPGEVLREACYEGSCTGAPEGRLPGKGRRLRRAGHLL